VISSRLTAGPTLSLIGALLSFSLFLILGENAAFSQGPSVSRLAGRPFSHMDKGHPKARLSREVTKGATQNGSPEPEMN
jgi:hypothetical protein